jgi:hypothetical protein
VTSKLEVTETEKKDDCTFLYFKPTGKWKYEGRGRFPVLPDEGWYPVDREAVIKENGGMPGITTDAGSLIVVIIPDEECSSRFAYPRLLLPTDSD